MGVVGLTEIAYLDNSETSFTAFIGPMAVSFGCAVDSRLRLGLVLRFCHLLGFPSRCSNSRCRYYNVFVLWCGVNRLASMICVGGFLSRKFPYLLSLVEECI